VIGILQLALEVQFTFQFLVEEFVLLLAGHGLDGMGLFHVQGLLRRNLLKQLQPRRHQLLGTTDPRNAGQLRLILYYPGTCISH
jgi:hypothetical protein